MIGGVLAAQLYGMVRPSRGRWYPFINYPMYARSSHAGKAYRTRQLRAGSCDARTHTAIVSPPAIGYRPYPLRDRIAAIAAGGGRAAQYRDQVARAVARHVRPRPCAVSIWQRTLTLTPAGVDCELLRHPRWVLAQSWSVR